MLSIDEGLSSVLDTLDKMAQRGWFSTQRAHGEDKLLLGSVPGRHQAIGCVAKKFTEERRMIVNNSYPHPEQPCFTCVGRWPPRPCPCRLAERQHRRARRPRGAQNGARGDLRRDVRHAEAAHAEAPAAPLPPEAIQADTGLCRLTYTYTGSVSVRSPWAGGTAPGY